MSNIIQMINVSEGNYLFIVDFTEDGELVFRTSRQPNYLQREKVVIEGEMVYTNLYFFHINYLKKFLNDRM